MSRRKKKHRKKPLVIFLAIIILALIVLCLYNLKIKKITFEGNNRLSEEELKEQIFSEGETNPLLFWLKSKFSEKPSIPFVEDYDIEMKSLTSFKITVYEKSIVGYIEYMNSNMYFDKDGIVVENSGSLFEDVPLITGIKFDSIVLHSKIPTGDDRLFNLILDITQLVKKYEIDTHRIHISESMEITLYIEKFRISLGYSDLGEKISTLSDILPNMQDVAGELNMREYNKSDTGYTFKKD